jgi:predicted type IV restriction endonuclease
MDFASDVRDLAKRSAHASKNALTEEATKTSVVLPFIKALGFDVFNLDEVVPEFVSDVGLKKGEKVDFVLKIGGKLSVLIEVKPISMSLGNAQYSQLYRYFGVTDARLAILTNGKDVWFFSDIDEPNKMDKKPFFTFDLQSHDDGQVQKLFAFHKSNFSIEAILEAASSLKYTTKAATYIKKQLSHPDDEFVKLVGRQIYDGMMTKTAIEQLRPAIQASLDEVIRDRIQDKLNVAFRPDAPVVEVVSGKPPEEPTTKSDVTTTDEEVQAFMIVRAISARLIKVDRITMRDSKSYCSVFVDDNNRKPVCRFYFNTKSAKSIGIFDAHKAEDKVVIESLSDIYGLAKKLEAAISTYL